MIKIHAWWMILSGGGRVGGMDWIIVVQFSCIYRNFHLKFVLPTVLYPPVACQTTCEVLHWSQIWRRARYIVKYPMRIVSCILLLGKSHVA